MPELGSNVHSIQFSDPLVRDEKNKEVVYIGDETTETESKHSDEEDWHNDPPDDYLEHVEGYEMVGYDTVTVPPPDEKGDEENTSLSSVSLIPPQAAVFTLTIEQARSALLSFVSAHCCYGTGAAKQMRITSMEYVPTHHYELQTFTEKRETNWSYAPHKGIDIDSATSGRAP